MSLTIGDIQLFLKASNSLSNTSSKDEIQRVINFTNQTILPNFEGSSDGSPSIIPALIEGGQWVFRPRFGVTSTGALSQTPRDREILSQMGPKQLEVSASPEDIRRGLYKVCLLAACHWSADTAAPVTYPRFNIPPHLDPDWTRVKTLGGGLYSTVHAYSHPTGVFISVKRLFHPEGISDFNNEVERLKACKHNNVVPFLGSHEDSHGDIYIYMPYHGGGDLAHLARTIQLDESDVKVLARQMRDGLIAIHSAGVIHRDLKCSNVLITNDGCVKIADLGCGVLRDQGIIDRIMGTIPWMAPEIVTSRDIKVKRAPARDWWSFGMTIVEMLKQGHPWTREPNQMVVFVWLGVWYDSPTKYQDNTDISHPYWLLNDLPVTTRDFLKRTLVLDTVRPNDLDMVNDQWFTTP